jgi:hypothetical protein
MAMTRHDPTRDPLADNARQLFERRSKHLDVNAASRLRQARRRALAGETPPLTRAWVPWSAATAAALLLAFAWWLPPQRNPIPASDDSALSASIESDALASEEDSELYAWLGDAPVAPDDGEAGSL